MQCHSETHLETMVSHLLKSISNSFIRRLHDVELGSDTWLNVRTNKKILISKFFYCHCSLCPDYRVDTTNYTQNKKSHTTTKYAVHFCYQRGTGITSTRQTDKCTYTKTSLLYLQYMQVRLLACNKPMNRTSSPLLATSHAASKNQWFREAAYRPPSKVSSKKSCSMPFKFRANDPRRDLIWAIVLYFA